MTTQTALDLVVERCCYLALRGCDCPTTGARLLPWQTSAQAVARGAGDLFLFCICVVAGGEVTFACLFCMLCLGFAISARGRSSLFLLSQFTPKQNGPPFIESFNVKILVIWIFTSSFNRSTNLLKSSHFHVFTGTHFFFPIQLALIFTWCDVVWSVWCAWYQKVDVCSAV